MGDRTFNVPFHSTRLLKLFVDEISPVRLISLKNPSTKNQLDHFFASLRFIIANMSRICIPFKWSISTRKFQATNDTEKKHHFRTLSPKNNLFIYVCIMCITIFASAIWITKAQFVIFENWNGKKSMKLFKYLCLMWRQKKLFEWRLNVQYSIKVSLKYLTIQFRIHWILYLWETSNGNFTSFVGCNHTKNCMSINKKVALKQKMDNLQLSLNGHLCRALSWTFRWWNEVQSIKCWTPWTLVVKLNIAHKYRTQMKNPFQFFRRNFTREFQTESRE